MNTGRYVFAQVADFIPRYEFDRIVRKYNGDYHVRELSCCNLFLHLMFGQLTACDSIRDICLCLKAHRRILYPIGFRQTVNVSSLSRANRDSDCRIWEKFGQVSSGSFRPLEDKAGEQRYRRRVNDLQLGQPLRHLPPPAVRRKLVLVGVVEAPVYSPEDALRPAGVGVGERRAPRHHPDAQMRKLVGIGEHRAANLAQGVEALDDGIEHDDQMLLAPKCLT